MEAEDEDYNIIDRTDVREDEENNNLRGGGYGIGKEGTAADENETRRKYFQRYTSIYQQDYREALRSLLWEPYDCRKPSERWYHDDPAPKRKSVPFSDSSASSSSSCTSIEDALATYGPQDACRPEAEERGSGPGSDWAEEEVVETDDLAGTRSTGDPVHKLMNIEIMVSDLHTQNGSGGSSVAERIEALASPGKATLASASQCNVGRSAGGSSLRIPKGNALNAVAEMLVTVEGTLEPRDSNEDTRLVSPDTSLDAIDGPANVATRNLDDSGPSGSNVSVVNCYRAVPVAVVSTVPTIKCLNAQENVSNVNIIQTGPSPPGRLPAQTRNHQAKRAQQRVGTTPAPSTSRAGTKKPEERRCSSLEQGRPAARTERDRPRSSNDPFGQQPGRSLGGSALSNHNRSVSNPVLGNPVKNPSRSGSQQSVPGRSEVHSGTANVPDRQQVPGRNAPTDAETTEDAKVPGGDAEPPQASPRTFTSTEAQTDDVPLGISLRSASSREQRRRERRERRHQRRLHQSVLNSGSVWQTNVDNVPRDGRGLPDILNSHMPPPYSAVTVPPPPPPLQQPVHLSPHGIPVPSMAQPVPPHLLESPPGSPPSHQGGVRFPFPFPGGGRRSRGQLYSHEEETPKSCCGVVVTQTVSIRWFIVMIAFVGICCVIVGTVLGAMKASGREHLTVSLLMIGVGIVLVTVSGVAWRLTSQDAPSCRSMLGLGGGQDSATEPNRRFVPRMPPSYGRPHHPYAAMMYPEFQYRPPPPSYQASMQEYRLRLLLLERTNGTAAGLQTAMSPPPTYRSHAGSVLGLRGPPLCRSLPQSEYSHPPSYRSRTSSTRPTLDPNGGPLGSVNHSRDPSLISHVSDQNGNVTQAVVNVISVMGNTVDLHQAETDIQIDSIKLGVDEEVPIPPLRMLLNKGKRSPTSSSDETKSENVNLVTIVTVSDNNAAPARDHTVESDVLAHL